MSLISFIDFIFPQFSPINWQAGISIFKAGGVNFDSVFGDLVSGKVKTGIGENYEVRMKLHSHGKCVQWMECNCQTYRRRNEKCSHLVAFCLFLDQERADILGKMNLATGDSDRHLLKQSVSNIINDTPKIEDKKQNININNSPYHILDRTSEIVAIDLSEVLPCLSVQILLPNQKNIKYTLNIDEAWKIVSEQKLRILFSKQLENIQQYHMYAKRVFSIQKNAEHSLLIEKKIKLYTNDDIDNTNNYNNEYNILNLTGDSENFCGNISCFSKKYGYIPIRDGLNSSQITKWNDLALSNILEGDTVANLCSSNFEKLHQIAEVILDQEIMKWKIDNKIEFSNLHVEEAHDGMWYVENNDIENTTLFSIIKARQEGRTFIKTKSGWTKIGESWDWLNKKIGSDGKIKLNTAELIKFREQFATSSEITGNGSALEKLKIGLISITEIQIPELTQSNLNLRPYQTEGLKWLWWLYQNRLGGLLADEMGLGKTHQAMGLMTCLAKTEDTSLSLVVCPTSVIDHWLDKIQRFLPQVKSLCFHGIARKDEDIINNNGHLVVVTSYGILLRDIVKLSKFKWTLTILDEAHLVKNQTTRTYRAALKLFSNMRLCLTGTPLENDLMELKNLFDYILPNYLGTDNEFKKKYITTANNIKELELHRFIHPFKMRRNKIEVLTDLPEKVEDIKYCHLKKEQFKIYEEALALRGTHLIDSLKNGKAPIPYVHIFSIISLLKQICNDPGIIDTRYNSVGSGKLDVFDELLEEALGSEQKVVVFSQYAKMVNKLSQRLHKKNIRHIILTGSTTNRGAVVKEFQENKDIKVFIGSLLAGGTGIDLTAANVVIHFDRWWNSAKENQATDRIHRIGQTKNVQVFKLVTKGTLEEKIDVIISKKQEIFERFVEQDNEMFNHLSREELLQLLSPPSENAIADNADDF